MRRGVRVVAWMLAGLAAAVAVLFVVLLTTDLSRFRPQLEGLASRAFGRPVVLAGAIEIEPSLRPRLVIQDVRVANPDWARHGNLARVDEFELIVALAPFLKGEIQVESVSLSGVDLWLEVDDNGRRSHLLEAGGETGALPAIAEFTVRDLQVLWRGPGDRTADFQVEKLTARNQPGEPVQLAFESDFRGAGIAGELEARKDLSGPVPAWQVTLDVRGAGTTLAARGTLGSLSEFVPATYAVLLEAGDPKALAGLFGVDLPAWPEITLDGNLRLEHEGLAGALTDLTGRAGDSRVEGQVRWDLRNGRPVLEAELAADQLSLPQGPARTGSDQEEGVGPAVAGALRRIAAVEGRLDLRAETLAGLEFPVNDLHLALEAVGQDLTIRSLDAVVSGDDLRASAVLPWGERLVRLMPSSGDWAVGPMVLRTARLEGTLSAGGDAGLSALAWDGPPARVAVDELRLVSRPAAPLEISGDLRIGGQPVAARLATEPLAVLLEDSSAPWETMQLAVEGRGLIVTASGRIDEPAAGRGFDWVYEASGPDVSRPLAMLGISSPARGAFDLRGRVRDTADRLDFDDLALRLGRSDLAGRISVEHGAPRLRIAGDLSGRLLHLEDWVAPTGSEAGSRSPPVFDPGPFADHDWSLALAVEQVAGPDLPLTDVNLGIKMDARGLRLSPLALRAGGARVTGRAAMDWPSDDGEPARGLAGLLARAEGQARVVPVDLEWRYQRDLMGFSKDIRLAGLDVTVAPGERVRVAATDLTVNGEPVAASLRLDPLEALLASPRGPWRQVTLELREGETLLSADGSIGRPLELADVDAAFGLRGPDVAELLPLVDFILPLHGPVSVAGRMTDGSQRTRFEELEITVGDSDLSGSVQVLHGGPRPRIELDLEASHVDLTAGRAPAGTEVSGGVRRIIPEQVYPLDRLRSVDGTIRFTGAQLLLGDRVLGDVRVEARLDDGLLIVEGLEVGGWGGAQIVLSGRLDASRTPAAVRYELRIRNLPYASMFAGSDLAAGMGGGLDATLVLEGTGSSRREFLATADGSIVIVGGPGVIGNRLVDLWGADLVMTMLSPQWIVRNETRVACLVAQIDVNEGLATTDNMLMDTERVTVAAAGSLDLGSEALDLVIAPRPKQASLVSLASPARVTGPLGSPEISRTTLPRERMAAAGAGLLAGVINPALLLFTLSRTGTGEANPCVAAVEEAEALKADLLP